MTLSHCVFVVDDDSAITEMICSLLRMVGGFDIRGFRNANELLEDFQPPIVDCVVADLRMPLLDGSQLQRRILEQDPLVSFVFVTGCADVKTAVKLMEQGAFTLLEKPFLPEELVAAVRRAADRTRELRAQQCSRQEAEALLGTLSDDEYKILECMMAGLPNKAISQQLTLASRTVDRRRQSILQKLKVNSVAELVATVTRFRAVLQ